jgi:hypothetical protein
LNSQFLFIFAGWRRFAAAAYWMSVAAAAASDIHASKFIVWHPGKQQKITCTFDLL